MIRRQSSPKFMYLSQIAMKKHYMATEKHQRCMLHGFVEPDLWNMQLPVIY